ncbi:MAG: NOB1 family endonuclease [Promethearchaeota archaeon]
MKKKASIYIFDTNIFLTGIDFNLIEGIIYTTPSIIEEVNDSRYKEKNRNILNRIKVAIGTNKLKIKVPKNEYITKISEVSKNTGDFNALSDPDKELLAISLELIETQGENIKIYSNDYSIENICAELNIPYHSLYKDGIKSKIIWEIFCPYCKKVHSSEDFNKICEICGSKLRRRPKK